MRPPKVFCVGFNKTGTTTLHRLFSDQLGLRSAHNPRWTDWSFVRDSANLDRYDVFTDGECPSLRDLDALYPDAKFILNTRPLAHWVLSRHKAVERSKAAVRWALTKYVPLGLVARIINRWVLDNGPRAMARWIAIRNTYHAHVLRYFEDRPEKLLVVNIEDEDAAARIAAFVELDVPVEAPHANRDGHGSMTNTILSAIGAKLRIEGSQEVVDRFFRERLPDQRDVLTACERSPFGLGRSGSDWLAAILPPVGPATRRLRHSIVAARSRSRSFLGKWLLDVLIGFLRSETDLHGFTTIHRLGSGSK